MQEQLIRADSRVQVLLNVLGDRLIVKRLVSVGDRQTEWEEAYCQVEFSETQPAEAAASGGAAVPADALAAASADAASASATELSGSHHAVDTASRDAASSATGLHHAVVQSGCAVCTRETDRHASLPPCLLVTACQSLLNPIAPRPP